MPGKAFNVRCEAPMDVHTIIQEPCAQERIYHYSSSWPEIRVKKRDLQAARGHVGLGGRKNRAGRYGVSE